MKIVCIIPARYESSRFPGKPLALIQGEPMIFHVWRKCVKFLGRADDIYIATDDERIAKECDHNNLQCIVTDSNCATGTDRVAQAARQIEADIIINVQGDEPLIDPGDIEKVATAAIEHDICCGMCDILDEADYISPNIPKVVATPNGRLLYISRSPIPASKSLLFESAKKQVCIYGFSPQALQSFAAKKHKTPLEQIEDIEILRFLELGYDVQMVEVSASSIAVDIPEDIQRVENALSKMG